MEIMRLLLGTAEFVSSKSDIFLTAPFFLNFELWQNYNSSVILSGVEGCSQHTKFFPRNFGVRMTTPSQIYQSSVKFLNPTQPFHLTNLCKN